MDGTRTVARPRAQHPSRLPPAGITELYVWRSGSRGRLLVGRKTGQMAEEGYRPVHVGSFVPLGQRARSRADARQAVVAPLVRRAALEEVQRPESAGPGQRDQQVVHGADVLHLHGQAIWRDLPYPQAIDHITGGAVVVLGEVEIGPAPHLRRAEVRPP